MGNVENFHEFLVIAKLECAFVAKSTGALGAAARVRFPFVGVPDEYFVSGKPIHNAQLDDVQTMVKGTSHHGQ